MRWLWLGAVVGVFGLACDPAETFGVNDVTRLAVEAEVPVVLRLPAAAVPALPEAQRLPLVAPVQVDVLQALQEAGAAEEAALIKRHRQKAQRIEVRALVYEVLTPSGMPFSLAPIELAVGPWTAAPDVEAAFPVGHTLAVPAGRAIATRELAYAPEGLRSLEVMLQPLAFNLYGRTVAELPAGAPIEAQQLTVRLSLKVTVHLDLAR